MTHPRFDPERTKVERLVVDIPNADGVEESRSGAWFIGAWYMTLEQKAAANRLKRSNEDWDWGKCNQQAGGRWAYCEFALASNH